VTTTSTSSGNSGTSRVVAGTEGNSVSEQSLHGGGDNSVVRHPRAYRDTTSAYTQQ